ncbi:hypothetical protein IW261DRAFT_1679957 [Armillaria novae-zelandiae]|uniref:Uncharacterized protein n=1 Tax=Armillaria novae-zelandiae TaxID=153914 RepID=A0AA39NL52_9AGAR|nr:hypothetical protein IW261DRAFT_1679957 [Armillaria novae-zelandiae]
MHRPQASLHRFEAVDNPESGLSSSPQSPSLKSLPSNRLFTSSNQDGDIVHPTARLSATYSPPKSFKICKKDARTYEPRSSAYTGSMTSTEQSTSAFLRDLLSKYNWVSTFTHSPDLVALVTTNTVPTTFQATQLKASIDDLNAPIINIQREIDLLRNAAASLEEKMIRLKDIKRDYRSALSSIRRLPSEIVAERRMPCLKPWMRLKFPPS